MRQDEFDVFLESALRRHSEVRPAGKDAVDRVLKRLAPLPRQKQPFWRLPDVLLDWEFAPAWPRMAALACCAVIGFAIGIAGLDRPFGYSSYVAGGGGIGTIAFEPDPLTGTSP